MRFKSFYLNERSERFEPLDLYPPELAKVISKECKKYVKETKGNWFQRGMSLDLDPRMPGGYRETRKDRKPLGMMGITFKPFNKWLVKNGHADRSKSISCSRRASSLFGERYTIFIEGNYKYTWLRGEDVNEDDDRTGWYSSIADDFFHKANSDYSIFGPEHLRDKKYEKLGELYDLGVPLTDGQEQIIINEFEKEVREWINKEFPKYFTTNKGMSTAFKNNYEIWFECKGYYFVRNDLALMDQMKRMIK